MFEFWREATATSVPGLLCQFGRRRAENVSILSSLLGYPRALRRSLKFERHSSKIVCEEFVLRSLVASPLTKARLTPGGWQEVKCVYWKVSVGL